MSRGAPAQPLDRPVVERGRVRAEGDRERIARDLHERVIHRVFATGMTLHGVQGLIEDPHARDRIDLAIADLDTVIRELRAVVVELGGDHLADRSPSSGASPRRPPETLAAHRLRAEQGCLDWLADPAEPDEVHLAGDGVPTPLTTLFGLLCTSSRRLPADAAATLGMAADTTIGVAAAELVLAVNDPIGPRCSSYRAAVHYLRDRSVPRGAPEDL
jgi:hypothetical protein